MGNVESTVLNSFYSMSPDEISSCQTPSATFQVATEALWQLINTLNEPAMMISTDYRICKVNKAMVEFLGLNADEILGQFCYKICHKQNAPIAICPHSKAILDHNSHSEELIAHCSGKPILVTVLPINDADGNYKGSYHFIKDMSEHYKLLAILKESRENFRSILDSQTDIIIRLDQKGCITFVNDYGCTFLGKTRQQLLRKKLINKFLPKEAQIIGEALADLTPAAPSKDFDCLISDASGQNYWIQFICLIIDINAVQSCVQLVGRNITALKQRGEQLQVSTSRALNGPVMVKLAACRERLVALNNNLPGSEDDDCADCSIELLDSAIADIATISAHLQRELQLSS